MASSDKADIKAAASTTFTSLWHQLAPHITVMRPMSDLCWVCQQNSVKIMRAANSPESAKSQVTNTSTYRRMLSQSVIHRCPTTRRNICSWPLKRGLSTGVPLMQQETLKKTFTVDGHLQVPPISSCLRPACLHVIRSKCTSALIWPNK